MSNFSRMSGDADDACVCATGIDRRRRETAERGVIFLCLLWNVLLRGRVLRWPNNSVRRNKERKLTACLVLITTAMDRAFYTDMAQTMEPDTFQRIIAGKGPGLPPGYDPSGSVGWERSSDDDEDYEDLPGQILPAYVACPTVPNTRSWKL